MVVSNTKSTANTGILYPHKNLQTYSSRKTNNLRGCDGSTERISAFVDTLLQPISTSQASYLKDSTDFINFIEETRIGKRTIFVSMDVTSLYTNIPQEEGITTVCKAYEDDHKYNPQIPTKYIKEILRHTQREIFTVQRKEVSTNSPYRHGY